MLDLQYVVDEATGEILEVKAKEGFAIDSDESANWVLEKLMQAEAALVAVQAEKAAVLKNIESRESSCKRIIDGLRYRFEGELIRYAQSKGEKTVKLNYGQIAFRTVKGGLRVADAEKALQWAKSTGLTSTVKVTEEFQISKLDGSWHEIAAKSDAFKIVPDEVRAAVKTGAL